MKILKNEKFDSESTVRAQHDGYKFIFNQNLIETGESDQSIGAYTDGCGTLQLVFLFSLYGLLIQQSLREARRL